MTSYWSRCSILILAIAASVAQDTPQKLPSELHGRVHDKAKKPLSNAILTLYECSDPMRNKCDTALAKTTSKSDGSFRLKEEGIKAGVYSLMAELPKYFPKMKVPVNIPDDNNNMFDFTMQIDSRDSTGRLIDVSTAEAKEIYAAAIVKDDRILAISAEGAMQNRPQVATAADDVLNNSAKVLNELTTTENQIPETVLAQAKCVAVIPSIVKGGFVIGGRHGRGAVTCRTANGWSSSAFISLAGGSWGAQIGVEKVDLVLLFMNDRGVNSLLKDNFKLGADAAVAAGPLGRDAEASTDAKLNAEILAYSRTKGVFAGVELNGAAIRADQNLNKAYYGGNINWHDTLSGGVSTVRADPFVSAVRQIFSEVRTR